MELNLSDRLTMYGVSAGYVFFFPAVWGAADCNPVPVQRLQEFRPCYYLLRFSLLLYRYSFAISLGKDGISSIGATSRMSVKKEQRILRPGSVRARRGRGGDRNADLVKAVEDGIGLEE